MQRRAFLSTAGAILATLCVPQPAGNPVREEAGDWSREHFNRRRYQRLTFKGHPLVFDEHTQSKVTFIRRAALGKA